MVLDTGDILDTSVGETVQKAESLGKEQYQTLILLRKGLVIMNVI